MASHLASAVDWTTPWMQPWREVGESVSAVLLSGVELHAALNMQVECVGQSRGPSRDRIQTKERAPTPAHSLELPAAEIWTLPQFVPQTELPPGMAYEAFIDRSARCPTRDNLHDFFNGLCWLHFPQAKRRLNQLQAAEIARQASSNLRGPVRDALTVLDENGALLDAPPAIWHALLARDWLQLFVTLRPLWREARLVLFGHALLEKLVHPRKTMVAHVYAAPVAITSIAEADRWLANALCADTLAHKPFAPLPVLGIPGWCAANEDPAFYDDSQAFRVPRSPGINR